MIIENEILRKYIKQKCNKYDEQDLSQSDIEKIKDISINRINFANQVLNIDLSELEKFPNLEILSLQNFEINEIAVNHLQKCKKLKILHLEMCNFKHINIFKVESLKKLIIKYCKVENWKIIYFPESVVIEAKGKIDLKDFNNIDKITNLSLNNLTICNFNRISDFENLKYLNIDGSSTDLNNIQGIIKNDIKFSNNKNSLPIG